MSDFQPMVSVIVPTTQDRYEFNERIKAIFFGQDYRAKQLVFNYEDGCMGHKRNMACAEAIGDIVVHMDSDDLYTRNWITKSVEALIKSEADIVGLSELLFYNQIDGAWYVYTYPPTMANTWIAGATFAYWKRYWEQNHFRHLNVGEDQYFLYGINYAPKIFAHEYGDGFVATIHDSNTSRKVVANPMYRRCTVEGEMALFDRWKDFVTNPNP